MAESIIELILGVFLGLVLLYVMFGVLWSLNPLVALLFGGLVLVALIQLVRKWVSDL